MSRAWALMLVVFVQAGAPAQEPAPDIDKLLDSALPEKREKGAALLGAQKNTVAAKRLIKLLKDEDWGVRMAALRSLAPISFGPGYEALLKQALKGETRAIRVLAAEMLRDHYAEKAGKRIGGKGLKRLKKKARLRPLEALGVIGSQAGILVLEGQVRAPDPTHRLAAVRALGRLHTGEKGLTQGLKDKEEEVRLTAAAGLASVDTDSARATVLDFVEKQGDDQDAWLLRRVGRHGAAANRDAFTGAVAARIEKKKKVGALLQVAIHGKLTGCGGAARKHFEARDPLIRAFAYQLAGLGDEPLGWADVRKVLKHKDRRLRYAAAQAYLERGGEPLPARLKMLLEHKHPDVAMAAVRKTVETKTREVLPALTELAAGRTDAKKGWMVRVAAAVAMGRVGEREAFEPLKKLSASKKWWLRAAAFEGLFHTYDKNCLPLMIGAFNDRQPVIRMTARKNLRYLTRKHYKRRKHYVKWWNDRKETLELVRPSDEAKRMRKGGYATKEEIQDILRGTDIVAVKARWDKVELVLEDLEVPHQAIRAQEIKVFGLSPKQVVLINCEGSTDSTTAAYLQWFVVAGGYMATTDWALVNGLSRTFPDVVGGYVKQSTGNDVVIVEPADPHHPMLEGVFLPNVVQKWWLEIQAFPIRIKDPVRATVLVDSLEMLNRYGSSVMMVTWPQGLGRVMHSTSHFYLQKEGFSHLSNPRERMIFASDFLGLSMDEIRELKRKGVFGNISNTTPISSRYSMFQLLVRFIDEKRRIDRES